LAKKWPSIRNKSTYFQYHNLIKQLKEMHHIEERYIRPSRVVGWEPNLHPVKGTTGYWNALSYFVKVGGKS
jgi:hypothetical protein